MKTFLLVVLLSNGVELERLTDAHGCDAFGTEFHAYRASRTPMPARNHETGEDATVLAWNCHPVTESNVNVPAM